METEREQWNNILPKKFTMYYYALKSLVIVVIVVMFLLKSVFLNQ